MKIKKYAEIDYIATSKKTLKEIKRDYKVMTVFMIILIILALTVCFKAMSLSIEHEALKREKEELEDLTEMQSSMISDLEENLRDLYVEIENLKFGGNR